MYFLSQQQPCTLGSPDRFATGNTNQVEAKLGILPEVFNRGHIGSDVYNRRDVVLCGCCDPFLVWDPLPPCCFYWRWVMWVDLKLSIT